MADLTMSVQYINNTDMDVVGFNLRAMWELFDSDEDIITVPAGTMIEVQCSPTDNRTIWPKFLSECTRLGIVPSKKTGEADKFSMGY